MALVETPVYGADDEALLKEMERVAWTGIDVPFGWPESFTVALAPRSQVIRHFGTWESAKEALNLWRTPSKMTTARRIEARFKARRMGKVWRYTPETLAETMVRCVADLGRPPRVAEYDWWRQEQLELAHAAGDALAHLPSASPFRKRWKTWNAALLALGYSPEWIAERLEEGVLPFEPSAGS